ncbi:lactate utilization protein B/C [Lonsdalea britannica]|uniref:LutC/YkgG family protein n=1 Tax=Lonsdalea britannica TaxID=1082704 RepID=UPI000A1F9C08|nr:lactate utilization protein C [Lonsdalea britannica]OSN07563.1 lactate utilization protein B/C [Lonsdalea britannica]
MGNANRDTFLAQIAQQLGRPVRHQPAAVPPPVCRYEKTRLADFSLQQRCDAFVKLAQETLKVTCRLTSEQHAAQAARELCQHYIDNREQQRAQHEGQPPVVISGDARLQALGITTALQDGFAAQEWDATQGEENIHAAEQADVGVVFAEYGLTESGGVVLFSAPERPRSLSLLPPSSIFVVRKSTLLPRVAQLAERLHQMAQAGERMPSCINLIGGPSSTADIELSKVIGVHGPVNAAYLIIEDC